jgi:ketosteroid isomerase-like protein
MANDNVELLRGTYEAFARGDIPGVMSAFAPDIEWNAPAVLPHGGQARGPEEVGQFFQGLGATWEDFGLELDDFVASGDRVCVIGRAHGRLKGQETGYGFAHCWTVRDGTCTRFDEYVDPEPAVYAS